MNGNSIKYKIGKIGLEIIKFLMDIPIILLSYIIPKDPNLYCFLSYYGKKFQDNPKYLYNFFKKKKKCVVISNDKKLSQLLVIRNIDTTHKYSLRWLLIVLRSKYFFVDFGIKGLTFSILGPIFGNFNIIQTWHGVGFKKIELLLHPNTLWERMNQVFTYLLGFKLKAVLATSKAIKEKFEKAFNSKKVYITGLPRNDVFFNPDLITTNYREKLGLDKFAKVILYAPTFREKQYAYPFTEEFLEKLDKWLESKNYVLLIKKHISDLALKIPSKYRRIWDVSKEVEDIQELLIHVDVLISDYSSVVTDFALLRRPIILYIYDLRRYVEECRDFYFDPREVFPGPFAYSQEELLELLKDLSWFEDPEYREKYEKFLDFFHTYKDGKSCERVERLLMELEGGGNV